jgi:PAS domain S-box-containing protein
MEAKSTKNQNKSGMSTIQAVIIENLYYTVYTPRCSFFEFVLTRISMSFIQLGCIAIMLETKQIFSCSIKESQGASIVITGMQISVPWYFIIILELFCLFHLFTYLFFWFVLYLSNFLEYSNRLLFIKNCFGTKYMQGITFYIMSLAGPCLLTFYLINSQFLISGNGDALTGAIFSIFNYLILFFVVIYATFGMTLNITVLCDKPTDNGLSLRTGTLLLFYENMNITLSILLILFQFNKNASKLLILVSSLLFAIFRSKEIMLEPYNNAKFNSACLMIFNCEMIVSFIIFLINGSIIHIESSIPITGLTLCVIILFGVRTGMLVNLKNLFYGVINADANISLIQIRIIGKYFAKLISAIKYTNKTIFYSAIKNEISPMFFCLAYCRHHLKNCKKVSCLCRGIDERQLKSLQSTDLVTVAKEDFNISSLIKILMKLLLVEFREKHYQLAEENETIYSTIHWLVHVEKNCPLSLTLISDLKKRKISFSLTFRLAMIEKEIMVYERSQAVHSEDYINELNEFSQIINIEIEYKTILKPVMSFIKNFEKMYNNYAKRSVNLYKISQICVNIYESELLYLKKLRTFQDNLKIQWLDNMFNVYFYSKFNKYSIKEIEKSQKVMENAEISFTKLTFYMLVSTEAKARGIIAECSKNIEQLLGIKKKGIKGVSINHFIPNPINKLHDKLIEGSLTTNKAKIMENFRRLFLIDDRGFIVPVKLVVKRYFDFKKSHFYYFAHIEKLSIKKEVIFCRQDGLIGGLSCRISLIFGIHLNEVVDKIELQFFIPSLKGFFDDFNNLKTSKDSTKMSKLIEDTNRKLQLESIYLFLRPVDSNSTNSNRNSIKVKRDSEPVQNCQFETNSLALVFSALQARTSSAPKRYKVKLNIQEIKTANESYFMIEFTTIKPISITNSQLKSKCVKFIFRMTLLKLFIRACVNKIPIDLILKKKDKKGRRVSAFKMMLRSMQSSNMLINSAMLASERSLKLKEKKDNNIIKALNFFPFEFTFFKKLGISGILLSIILGFLFIFYVGQTSLYSFKYFSIAFSEAKFIVSSGAFLNHKTIASMSPSVDASNLIKSINSNKTLNILANFYIFQNNTDLFTISKFNESKLEYKAIKNNFEVPVNVNLFDQMLEVAQYLNKLDNSLVSVDMIIKKIYSIQLSQKDNSSGDLLITVLDSLDWTINFATTLYTIFILSFLTLMTVILFRIQSYLNLLYTFGLKIDFSEKIFKKLNLFKQKIGDSLQRSSNYEKESDPGYLNVPNKVVRIRFNPFVLVTGLLVVVGLFGSSSVLIHIWNNKFSMNMNRFLEIQNLFISNSYQFTLALEKILRPSSNLIFDQNLFIGQMVQQEVILFDSNSDFPEFSEYVSQFRTDLCNLRSVKNIAICSTIQNGIFMSDYKIVINYLIHNLPQWLNSTNISNISEIYCFVTLTRLINSDLNDIIGQISLNFLTQSLSLLQSFCFLMVICHVVFLYYFIAYAVRPMHRKLASAFRMVKLLKPSVIKTNSKMKDFVEYVNKSV